jgi:hypothetical protein
MAVSLMVYCGTTQGSFQRVMNVICRALPEYPPEVFDSMDKLVARLRTSINEEVVAVILPADLAQLRVLASFSQWFSSARLLLILPDLEEETIACGHLLRPRFLTWLGGDLHELAAVLQRMGENGDSVERINKTESIEQDIQGM